MRRGLVAVVAVVAAFIRGAAGTCRELGPAADQGRRRERAHGPEREQLPRQAEHHPRRAGRGARRTHGRVPGRRRPRRRGVDRRAGREDRQGTRPAPRREDLPAEGQGGRPRAAAAPGERGRRAPDLAAAQPSAAGRQSRAAAAGLRRHARKPRIRSPARCKISQWEKDNVVSLADSFSLPTYGDWPKRVLRRAVHFIGYPYVWGGMSENQQVTFGVTSRGGFDCSGFVWRVYKLQPYPNGGSLSSAIQGRTTYQMSGEVPKSKRIRVRPPEGRRCRLLRRGWAPLEPVRGRPHGNRARKRLDDPFLQPGSGVRAAHGLVSRPFCLGPPAAPRGRAPVGAGNPLDCSFEQALSESLKGGMLRLPGCADTSARPTRPNTGDDRNASLEGKARARCSCRRPSGRFSERP